MNEKTLELIDKYAAKLGTTSDKIFEVVKNQMLIEFCFSIFFICLTFSAWFFVFKKYKKDKELTEFEFLYTDNTFFILKIFLSLFGLVVMSIISSFLFYNITTMIINPNYWALNHVLGKIK